MATNYFYNADDEFPYGIESFTIHRQEYIKDETNLLEIVKFQEDLRDCTVQDALNRIYQDDGINYLDNNGIPYKFDTEGELTLQQENTNRRLLGYHVKALLKFKTKKDLIFYKMVGER